MVGGTDATAELVGDLVVACVGVAETSDELGEGGGGKRGASHGGGRHTDSVARGNVENECCARASHAGVKNLNYARN